MLGIYLKKLISDLLIIVIQEIDSQTNEPRWSNWSCHWKLIKAVIYMIDYLIRAAIYTNRLYAWLGNCRCPICLTYLYAWTSSTLDVFRYRQNWSKQEIKGKRVIQVFERILLLSLIQWIIIQGIERYETNGLF